jgi:tellurite resistance protein TerC
MSAHTRPVVRTLRRIGVAFVGGLVVAVGVVMIVLPGPAIMVIPAGLAILATEFAWARRLLHLVREPIERGLSWFRSGSHSGANDRRSARRTPASP